MNKINLIVITGATACGKTRISNALLQLLKHIEKFITTTTRQSREGEANGVHYWFRALQDFLTLVEEKGFFEHEEVFGGTYYGMEYAEMKRVTGNYNMPLVVLDVNGARKLMNNPEVNALVIFLDVPSDILWARFMKSIELGERKNDSVSPEERKERMKMEIESKKDFSTVVENIDFDKAVAEVRQLITDFLEKYPVAA